MEGNELMDVKKLANEIIDGRRLGRTDDLDFLKDCSLDELTKGACIQEHFN